jgi:uncharacterized protein YcbK (DUF882 family)
MSELDSKCPCGCGLDLTDEMKEKRALVKSIFEYTTKEKYISTSLARCPDYNKRIGGSRNSAHMRGQADDVATSSSTIIFKFVKVLMLWGVDRIFINFDKNIVHWDIGKLSDGYAQTVLGKD